MQVLWSEPDAEFTARSVSDALGTHAYTTIATILDRLDQKGIVTRHPEGRVHRYRANGSQAALSAMLMREALAVTSDPDSALDHFVRVLSGSEAESLGAALRRRARASR